MSISDNTSYNRGGEKDKKVCNKSQSHGCTLFKKRSISSKYSACSLIQTKLLSHHFIFFSLSICSLENLYFICLAGIPPTIEYGSTSLVTIAPAAIQAPSPIVRPPKIVTLLPIQTSFPILQYLWFGKVMTSSNFCYLTNEKPDCFLVE